MSRKKHNKPKGPKQNPPVPKPMSEVEPQIAPETQGTAKGREDLWVGRTAIAGVILSLLSFGVSYAQYQSDRDYKARERAEKDREKSQKQAEKDRLLTSLGFEVGSVDGIDYYRASIYGKELKEGKPYPMSKILRDARLTDFRRMGERQRPKHLQRGRFLADRLGILDEQSFSSVFSEDIFEYSRVEPRVQRVADSLVTIHGQDAEKLFKIRYELRVCEILAHTSVAFPDADNRFDNIISGSLKKLTDLGCFTEREWSHLSSEERAKFYQRFADDFALRIRNAK